MDEEMAFGYSVPYTHVANSEYFSTGNPQIYDYNAAPEEANFVEKVGYSLGAGLVNAGVSFINSGKALYNLTVSDENESELIETADVLRKYSNGWANFYQQNETAIDFTSDLVATLIPGTAAVKLLSAAGKSNAAIKAAKELGQVPKFSDRALGKLDIFDTQGRRAAFEAKAMKADSQAPLFRGYNFLRAREATFESLNESAVVTAATSLALNQSSLFEDYETTDFLRDVAFGTALTAPIRYLTSGKRVTDERVKQGLAFNAQNRVSGDFTSDPLDERISRKFQDLRNVQDVGVRQKAMLSIQEDMKGLMKGNNTERAAMYGALSKHIDNLDEQTYNELWLGTKEIRYFDPGRAEDPSSLFINSKTGTVKLLEEITPTAGDQKIEFTNDGKFFLTKQGDTNKYTIGSFIGNAVFEKTAAEVEGHRLNILYQAMRNKQFFNVEANLAGPEKFAMRMKDWAQIEAGYNLALRDKTKIPFIGKDNKKRLMLDANEIKLLLKNEKKKLVETALNSKKLSVEDINVRFGVNVEKMLATNFDEGYILKTVASTDEVKRLAQPTHVVRVRTDEAMEFPDQNTFLGQMDVKARQYARKESYFSTMGPTARSILGFDIEQLAPIDASKATINSESAGLLLPGGRGAYASPIEAAETNGTMLSTVTDKAKRKMLDPFVPLAEPIAQNPTLRAELAATLAYVRSQPAKLTMVDQADGTSILFDDVMQVPLLDQRTKQPFIIGKEVTRFLQQGQKALDELNEVHNTRSKATGRGSRIKQGVLYAPPPNLNDYPHVAFAKAQNGQVRMLYSQTAEDLQEQINAVRTQIPGLEINTVTDANRKKALYAEFRDSSLFDDPDFDFALNRVGSSAPLIPRSDERVVGDYLEFIAERTGKLVRGVARDAMSDELNELQFMGQQWDDAQKTIANRGDGAVRKGNPYHDLIKTALNYNKFEEFTAIQKVNETFESIYSRSMGTLRQAWADKFEKGKYDEAKDEIAKHFERTGQKFDVSDMTNLMISNRKVRTTQLNDDVNTLNGVLATLSLGLDFLHPAINAIGFGVVGWPELRSLAKKFGKEADLDSALSVVVPGSQGTKMPAPSKVMAGVIRDMFDKTKRDAMRQKYAGSQTIDSKIFESQDSIEESIRLMAQGPDGAVKNYVKKNIDKIKQYSVVAPNAWMQILAHESADRLVRAAGLTDERLISSIRAQFSKRVNGNYTASQRGALLQGPLGHALGLFQTWTLGVASNMMRYVANKEASNIAAFIGAQSAMFGVQSNPLFQALNGHLAARDKDNEGLYQKYTDLGEFGDFFLYGVPSAASGMSLYTRGDITPRNPTILPTSLDQIPIVNATMRVFNAGTAAYRKTLSDFEASGVTAFGNVDNTFMSAIALSGLNRPAAGLAQLYNGYSQISAAGLGGQVIDPDIVDWSAYTRVLGSRPLTEQKTLDAYYRHLDVEAADRKKTMVIGATVRQKVANGEDITSDDIANFTEQYISAGGNPKGVKQFFTQQMMLASTPLADRMFKRMHTDNDMAEWRALMASYEAPGE